MVILVFYRISLISGTRPNVSYGCNPADTSRNNDVITSTRRHFDVSTSKWRRFYVITTLLLGHVFSGKDHHWNVHPLFNRASFVCVGAGLPWFHFTSVIPSFFSRLIPSVIWRIRRSSTDFKCQGPRWNCHKSKYVTFMYVKQEPGAKANQHWCQVGWMLANHMDGLLRSSF